ncbi:MAG: TlpA family protein disulfide reductase, partial [Phycisphaerales bacterium]|nr:TlpA family protein disulfide reductase [Phycisphaerales bacterium]
GSFILPFATAIITAQALAATTTVSLEAPRTVSEDVSVERDEGLIPSELIKVGVRAPDFTVTSLEDETVQLSSFRGKVVVLSFWFRPCGACSYELDQLQRFNDWISDEDAPVVSLVMDEYSHWKSAGAEEEDVPDRRESTRRYLADRELSLDVLVDPVSRPVGAAYGVRAYPTRVVIDPDGRVSAVSVGKRDDRLVDILKSESLAAWHAWQARQLHGR